MATKLLPRPALFLRKHVVAVCKQRAVVLPQEKGGNFFPYKNKTHGFCYSLLLLQELPCILFTITYVLGIFSILGSLCAILGGDEILSAAGFLPDKDDAY